eukprot:CAMPEP_0171044992 /NCGR_PEP_ID=MMETSP0736-20130129/48287_1 /TAXON_ID=186038 /ORGANISM="Fragilariopsis kerguelensis, Strain L26-C5" /LENGTH=66 /DNA_ID=CAMNT_0011494983 /DNA_START=1 /DNA_END=197 /DNA_ORIENTATION=+
MEQHQYNYNKNGEIKLVWPEVESMEEVLSALINVDHIGQVTCDFNNEYWDTSQELRDALILAENSS